ncbi:ABC transporter ATP-binding protein [Bifidobacterium sp. 82T10]|uniref:ABC transporter ATP-binding protein n=1 Tax=Bifidobacterium miconis TaxID=2834435 RepID=A0ABS6WHU2_9BIFI|nr:ABC transporter ATP-binding protein [Bifidobacterium miconis]MBW3093613.1 ABC transporter ATP-binding protein [Bifidobacterium miconis]
MGPVVELKDVGHAFGERTRLFRGITLTLLPERVYALVGPSGSGKSTLLSIIAGWQTPSEGEVVRRGVRKVSWVFQNPVGVARRTALDHVTLPYLGQGYDIATAERLALEQLDRFGLSESAGKRFGELSGGEAQRLMLARGVATNADLLLVDEPTAQLDMRTADAVDRYLGALSRSGMIVVVATHDHRTRDAASDVIDLERYQ